MEFPQQYFSLYTDEGKLLIRKAWDYADAALKDDLRDNGHPFIEHPLGVARIVCDEIGLPAECAAAVFVHEAGRLHPESDPSKENFPEEVLKMVNGLDLIATIKPKDTRLEAENYKKLIVKYSDDPRVTVLKIADRLEIMRNLDFMPKASRERKILETLLLYIPLAHQLGLYNIKSELEDIYFRYSEPEQYRAITNKLKAGERDRERLMQDFIEPLKKDLSDAGIHYELKIRTKTAWSIYKKMLAQKVPFEGVFDVFAIRFIIDCEPDPKTEKDLCWKVYSYVTKEYEPDTSRLRDWVTQPKPNGYESLHITVRGFGGECLEVQIRTQRMDDIAENGLASHWAYKGIRREESLSKWLQSVRYQLEHPGSASADDLPKPPSKEIFVFTPTGELRILPDGASVLDFAFNIHTKIGTQCTGGKIGGKAVSIREKLKTGDVVEVMTSKNQKPTSDWLSAVVTSKARTKIRQMLNEVEYRKAADGKELLARRLKNWKLELPDEKLNEYLKKQHIGSVNSFYAALGDGSIDVNDIKAYIQEFSAARSQEDEDKNTKPPAWVARTHDGGDDILVLNAKDLKGLDYKMAKCCNPVFGDDVFGFVTRDAGIKIHRISCPNASRLLTRYPYRIQKVRWAESPSGGSFQTALRVTSAAESVVINQIMEIIGSFKASLRTFTVTENNRSGTYEILLRVSVPSNMELDKVISQIKLLRHVIKVNRA